MILNRAGILLGVLVAALLWSNSAAAVEVYFNGVQVTGLKSQSFSNCAVRFDKQGNVHITAKGYSVKRAETGGSAATPPPGTKIRYFLVSQASRPGYAQYDIDVTINGTWVKKIRNKESQVVMPITDRLRRGANVIQFTATKNYGGKPRLSQSGSDRIQVIVGSGTKGGGTFTITNPLATFVAKASDTRSFSKQMTITIK